MLDTNYFFCRIVIGGFHPPHCIAMRHLLNRVAVVQGLNPQDPCRKQRLPLEITRPSLNSLWRDIVRYRKIGYRPDDLSLSIPDFCCASKPEIGSLPGPTPQFPNGWRSISPACCCTISPTDFQRVDGTTISSPCRSGRMRSCVGECRSNTRDRLTAKLRRSRRRRFTNEDWPGAPFRTR
jgi:hypothetical protein